MGRNLKYIVLTDSNLKTKLKQMFPELLKEYLAKAVADLELLFTSEKLKKELFTYCETTETDISHSYFFTKRSGHQRRITREMIITPESILLVEEVLIKWDNTGDFLILVESIVPGRDM